MLPNWCAHGVPNTVYSMTKMQPGISPHGELENLGPEFPWIENEARKACVEPVLELRSMVMRVHHVDVVHYTQMIGINITGDDLSRRDRKACAAVEGQSSNILSEPCRL